MSYDRLSRNAVKAIEVISKFAAVGVKVIAVSEPPESIAAVNLLLKYAKEYEVEVVRQTIKARTNKEHSIDDQISKG